MRVQQSNLSRCALVLPERHQSKQRSNRRQVKAHLKTSFIYRHAPKQPSDSKSITKTIAVNGPRSERSATDNSEAGDDLVSLLVSSGLTLPVCMGIESLAERSQDVLGNANVQEASLAVMCLIAPQIVHAFKSSRPRGESPRLETQSSDTEEWIDTSFTAVLLHNALWLHAIFGPASTPVLSFQFAVGALTRVENKKVNDFLKEMLPSLCGIGLFAQTLAQYQIFRDVPNCGVLLAFSMYAQSALLPIFFHGKEGNCEPISQDSRQMAAQAVLCVALISQLQLLIGS